MILKSVPHGCYACGAATPSSASLLRSRRAVARACIPGPRELVGRRVPPTGPARVACTCTQSIWASCTYGPMMDAPSALRGAGGCSSFSDRASALSAGDTRAGLAQLARGPAEAATTARRTYREGRGANLALSRSRPLRNHVDTHSTQFVFTTRSGFARDSEFAERTRG